MELMRQIDGYCERTDAAFWAEPINALSNLAFVIAAIWMWRASSGLAAARLLSAILFAIGVGSFLFHTFATVWAAIADVVPIVLFVLVYLYLVNRDIVGLRRWSAALATSLSGMWPWRPTAAPNSSIRRSMWRVPKPPSGRTLLMRSRNVFDPMSTTATRIGARVGRPSGSSR